MKCDCGKLLTPVPSDDWGRHTVGISCQCGVYWDVVHTVDKLYGTFVRWNCSVCGSSRQLCKNAPPISKCYRGPDMMTAHLSRSDSDD